MAEGPGGRRRIDRVTSPDLLDDVAHETPSALRALRDDCRQEETRLSYARRVVQGQLDIARAELRRRQGEESETASLVEQLSAILADAPSGSTREARTVSFYAPEAEPGRRSGDSFADLSTLGKLPDLDTGEITALIDRLEAEERRLSAARRAVLANLDGLQEELVRRYREGDADVEAILSAALPRLDEDA